MKFISRNANLRIILKPGMPAQPVLGIPAVWSVSVKFQDGLAEIKDEKIIEKMLTHTGYNTDFIVVDEDGNDPFANTRDEIEPGHVLSEIKYGHVERSVGSPKNAKMTPEMQSVLTAMANDMANKKIKEMLPSLIEDTMMKMAQISADKKKAEDSVIDSVEWDSSLLDDTTPITTKKITEDEIPTEYIPDIKKKASVIKKK